jgi:hypothetical protein
LLDFLFVFVNFCFHFAVFTMDVFEYDFGHFCVNVYAD